MNNLISDNTFMIIQATHIIIVAVANVYYFSKDDYKKFIHFHWFMLAVLVVFCVGMLAVHGVMVLTKMEL